MYKDQYVKIFSSIHKINNDLWNNCNIKGNVFVSYNFIKLLEDSGSVNRDSGWSPLYFVLFKKNTVLACAPCFLKTHSQGEYVFDHSWANAYKQLGIPYYPKLLIASPFTPVSGNRILSIEENSAHYKNILLKEIIKYCISKNISGIHANFLLKDDLLLFKSNDFLIRSGIQYHFINKGYKKFDDFLFDLSYKKRKNILKERKSIKNREIKIEILEKRKVTKEVCNEIYLFYLDTIEKKWSYNYLTKDFFDNLPKYLGDEVIIIVAKIDNNIVAASLNFHSNNCLYGRYWGSKVNIPFLHFEICYYSAIEFAIKNGLEKVEAGAQGEHKIQRGYVPQETFSAHLMFDNKLKKAISQFVDEEKKIISENINLINKDYTPFKSNC